MIGQWKSEGHGDNQQETLFVVYTFFRLNGKIYCLIFFEIQALYITIKNKGSSETNYAEMAFLFIYIYYWHKIKKLLKFYEYENTKRLN